MTHRHNFAIFYEKGRYFIECTTDCPTMSHMEWAEVERRLALSEDADALRERLEVAGRLVYAALKDVEPHDWPDGFDIVLWHKTQTAEFAALASQPEVKP